MGWFSGKDYGKKTEKKINAALGPAQFAQIGSLFGGANQSLLRALESINAGYSGAKSSLAMQGALGARQIGDVATQGMANATQSAIGRGLYGTTYLDAANRAVGNQQSRSLAELNSMLAQIGSNIDIGQGMAQANVYGQLAGAGQNYASLLGQLHLGKAGLMAGVQYGKQGGLGKDLIGAGAQLGSAAIFSSDRRLKRNIVSLGNGMYEFNYKGLPGLYRGVLADEWLHVPGAVVEIDGYLHVDYAKIGRRFERVA